MRVKIELEVEVPDLEDAGADDLIEILKYAFAYSPRCRVDNPFLGKDIDVKSIDIELL